MGIFAVFAVSTGVTRTGPRSLAAQEERVLNEDVDGGGMNPAVVPGERGPWRVDGCEVCSFFTRSCVSRWRAIRRPARVLRSEPAELSAGCLASRLSVSDKIGPEPAVC